MTSAAAAAAALMSAGVDFDVDPGAAHRSALGAAIRAVRANQGLTLRELGRRIGVSAATLSGIETGKTGLSSARLASLAETLGVGVDRLLAPMPTETPGTSGTPGTPGTPQPSPHGATEVPDPGWREYRPLVLDPVLAGALMSFLDLGYHGASMRVVAARAGLSVPGLYHYHRSKQDLLVALLDLTMHDLRERLEAARREADDTQGRLCNVVECLALFHTHRRVLGFVGASEMRSLEPDQRERVASLRNDVQRLVDEVVEVGADEGVFATPHPHEAARAVTTMCTALAQWFRPDGPATAEQVAEQYVDFALALVGASPRFPPGSDPRSPAQQS